MPFNMIAYLIDMTQRALAEAFRSATGVRVLWEATLLNNQVSEGCFLIVLKWNIGQLMGS